MHEDKDDEQRTNIFHEEEIDMEEVAAKCTPVGELVVYHLVGQVPAYEEAGKEAADRKEHLTCNKVEDVEKCLSEERQSLNASKRQRAKGSHDTTADSDDECCLVACDAKLLLKECRADLVEGD